jgi:DNA-binding NarL/FixJ family response regulator
MGWGEKRRILLVDDHAGVRHGLALVLAEEGVEECREASGREEALQLIDAAGAGPPDAALVDLSPRTEDSLQLVADLSARHIPVLVCSIHDEASYVRRALAAGARGYLTKVEAPKELARALRDILEGWMLVSPRAAADLP